MPKEPNYYEILGLRPEADDAAIDAAYRGRSLRFRVGEPRTRGAESTGPTQEQMAQAYAVLGNPEARAIYDAVYFPDKQPVTKRRRIPLWLWAIVGVWIVALLAVVLFGLRSRTQSDGGAVGRIAGQTATIIAEERVATSTVASPGSPTPSGSPTSVAALLPPTATSTVPGATATIGATSTASIAPTTAPTATVEPTNTATVPPPTVTIPPTAVAVEPPAVPPATEPEPEPTATPEFRVTDRIGTALSVNLRGGPGAAYPSLGLLPTGTPLQATGETARVGGQLWRRFLLQDGRVGWVRDLDVLPAR